MQNFLPSTNNLEVGNLPEKMQLDSLAVYPPANYMSFMFTPYGIPSERLIGPLTA